MIGTPDDESTDIDSKALVYVRYLYQENVHKDLLCALSLPTNATGAELFKSHDVYISGKLKGPFISAYAQTELLP